MAQRVKIIRGKKSIQKKCEERGISFLHTVGISGSFIASNITLDGEIIPDSSWKNKKTGKILPRDHFRRYEEGYDKELRERWKGVSEEIKGLRCPDCDCQAFKTDQEGVAVCGGTPGWFFFYTLIKEKKEAKKKIVIQNGQMVEVDEESKDQDEV